MLYLKSNSDSFSAIFCLWSVSSKCTTIISQHTWTPFALVPLFHGGNFMVKSLSVLIAHCTEIFWEEV